MANFPTSTDLSGFDGDDANALAAAETIISNAICPGKGDVLREASRTTTLTLANRWVVPPYVPQLARRRLSASELGYWPITGLTTLELDGVDITSECVVDRFGIYRKWDTYYGFPNVGEIEVTYTTGYADGALPENLRLAILTLGNIFLENPTGIESHKVGDVSTKFSRRNLSNGFGELSTLPLPAHVLALISPYQLEEFASA